MAFEKLNIKAFETLANGIAWTVQSSYVLDGRQTATGPPSHKVVRFSGADLAPPVNRKCIWVISG